MAINPNEQKTVLQLQPVHGPPVAVETDEPAGNSQPARMETSDPNRAESVEMETRLG